MGYMRHHAIVVSGPRIKLGIFPVSIYDVRDKCAETGALVSPVMKAKWEGTGSFFVAPDGSKEGWAESDAGDNERQKIIEYLDSLRYSDGSTSFKWAEVQFGDDNGQTIVTRHSDEPQREAARAET